MSTNKFAHLLLTEGAKENLTLFFSFSTPEEVPRYVLKNMTAHSLTEALLYADLSEEECAMALELPLVKNNTQSIYALCTSNRWAQNVEILLPLVASLTKRAYGSYWAKEIICSNKEIHPKISNKLLEIILLSEYSCQAYDLLKYVPHLLTEDERAACVSLIKNSDTTTKRLARTHLRTLNKQEKLLLSV